MKRGEIQGFVLSEGKRERANNVLYFNAQENISVYSYIEITEYNNTTLHLMILMNNLT